MIKHCLTLLFIFLLVNKIAFAQKRYFVYLKDKSNSTFSISKPENFLSARAIKRRTIQGVTVKEMDLPMNASYITDIKNTGASIIYTSKWANAAMILANDAQLTLIKNLSFVSSVFANFDNSAARIGNKTSYSKKLNIDSLNFNYGNALVQIQQLNADSLHKKGYTGKGVLVAILDAGFLNANKIDALSSLFSENRVVYQYDFVDNELDVFDDDTHGTEVLSLIAGYLPGKIIGTAPEASVALIRTEDAATESKIEEINWLLGAEKADSLGADLITTSLGYTQFDNASQNYTYADMNGHSTISAKAANWAAATGMLVFAAAGNDGNSSWHYIGTPADADSVIAIGAVTSAGVYSTLTSYGPNSSNQLKPQLAAMGQSTTIATPSNTIVTGSGTSFATPLVAGFVASIKQQYPNVNNSILKNFLFQSASQYTKPDYRLGYGIPNYKVFNELIAKYLQPLGITNESVELILFPNPVHHLSDLKIMFMGQEAKENNFEIMDMQGRKLFNFNYAAKNIQQNLPAGTYILKLKNTERDIYSKFNIF